LTDHSHPDASQTAQYVQEMNWQTSSVSRTVSYLFVQAFGFSAFGDLEPARLDLVDGRRCLVGSIFAFDIAAAVAYDIDETVELDLEVMSGSCREVLVAYDAHGTTGRTVRRVVPEQANSGWVRLQVPLERARLAGRGPRGTDLVVAGMPCDASQRDTDQRLILSDLTLRRPQPVASDIAMGTLALTVLDEHGRPTAARMGLYDSRGSSHLASADAMEVPWFDDTLRQVPLRTGAEGEKCEPWPSADRWVCHVDGTYSASLPADTYSLVLSKGHEYRRVVQQVHVPEADEVEVTVQLDRWTDLPSRGWYSGDNHVHMSRSREQDSTILAVARAEDVHVTNLLAMGNLQTAYYDQYAYGATGQAFDGGHALVSGQEDPRTSRTGHTVHLNIDRRVRDHDSYFVYHEAFEQLRRGGALSGYAHVGSGWFDEARGLALDVPFGIVDLVEVLQGNELHTDLWYDFLNLGYRLTPSAGSDHPYIDLLGTVRSYVHVDGPFTPARWFDALRAGRTFVSSAPILELQVVGHGNGSSVDLSPGERVIVHATAASNPDLDRLHRLELVVGGQTVAETTSAGGSETLALEHDFRPSSGTWLAAKCYGSSTCAHSAPVYLTIDRGPTFAADLVPDLVHRMQTHLRELVESVDADSRLELERWISSTNYQDRWSHQLPRIVTRARAAHSRYDELLGRARACRKQ
jgi:hypothetical protein